VLISLNEIYEKQLSQIYDPIFLQLMQYLGKIKSRRDIRKSARYNTIPGIGLAKPDAELYLAEGARFELAVSCDTAV
jgi:hypothetical protein